MKSRLRNIKMLTPIFSCRDWIMAKCGLFEIKAEIKRERYFKKAAREDRKKREEIARKILTMTPLPTTYSPNRCNFVASMTSYGKRVVSSAPYALYSIFAQKQKPDKIVLNLDEQKWNEGNIPELLKVLLTKGLTIQYIHDVGPHTKFLPTLKSYPNDVIITFDDDIYYEDNSMTELLDAYHHSNKRTVLCREGKFYPDENNITCTYSKLPDISNWAGSGKVLPFGVGGVLYPPHLFSDEIFNETVFRELCPCADDIWFSIMEFREHIQTGFVLPNSWTGTGDIDRNEEYNPKVSSALYRYNDLQGKNDFQFDALVKYYQL